MSSTDHTSKFQLFGSSIPQRGLINSNFDIRIRGDLNGSTRYLAVELAISTIWSLSRLGSGLFQDTLLWFKASILSHSISPNPGH